MRVNIQRKEYGYEAVINLGYKYLSCDVTENVAEIVQQGVDNATKDLREKIAELEDLLVPYYEIRRIVMKDQFLPRGEQNVECKSREVHSRS